MTIKFSLIMDTKFNKVYWDSRYSQNQTGWDVGEITTPLKTYFDQLETKNLKILIPGGGNAYEAEYLFHKGFEDLTVLDISDKPLLNLKERIPAFPESQLICGDFFAHNGQYDLIVEQTFFCALHPSLRPAYAQKMAELLKPEGNLAGVLFNAEFEGGPPFGGNRQEYLEYFKPFFKIKTFESCYNSIKPRAGRELFIILTPCR
jgi:methyl halide transferase